MAHCAPAVPHDPNDSEEYASHEPPVPPTQQPAGQVFASHAQTPVLVSQRLFVHAVHAAPPFPHMDPVSFGKVSQTPLLQHPLGQEFASHTHRPVVRSHSWSDAQPAQVAPPVPQVLNPSDAYGTHSPVVELQHPRGQEFASHTHCPVFGCPVVVMHSSPVTAVLHETQAPPLPQAVSDSMANGVHVPSAAQHPAHAPPPQLHTPFVHVSPLPHAPHWLPPVPHWFGP